MLRAEPVVKPGRGVVYHSPRERGNLVEALLRDLVFGPTLAGFAPSGLHVKEKA
jgi:hypothetical protein